MQQQPFVEVPDEAAGGVRPAAFKKTGIESQACLFCTTRCTPVAGGADAEKHAGIDLCLAGMQRWCARLRECRALPQWLLKRILGCPACDDQETGIKARRDVHETAAKERRGVSAGDDAGGGAGGPDHAAKLESSYHELFTKHMVLCEQHGKLKAETEGLRAAVVSGSPASSPARALSFVDHRARNMEIEPALQNSPLPLRPLSLPVHEDLGSQSSAPARPSSMYVSKAYAIVDNLEVIAAQELADLELDFIAPASSALGGDADIEGLTRSSSLDSFETEEAALDIGEEFPDRALIASCLARRSAEKAAAVTSQLATGWSPPAKPPVRPVPEVPLKSDNDHVFEDLEVQITWTGLALPDDGGDVQPNESTVENDDTGEFSTPIQGEVHIGTQKQPGGRLKEGSNINKEKATNIGIQLQNDGYAEEEVGADGCESARQRNVQQPPRRGKPSKSLPSVVTAPRSKRYAFVETYVPIASPPRRRPAKADGCYKCGIRVATCGLPIDCP